MIRVSTLKQADNDKDGFPRQQEDVDDTIAYQAEENARNLSVIRPFRFIKSGKDVVKTPEFGELLALIKSGKAKGLVISDITRLSRNDEPASIAELFVPFFESQAKIYYRQKCLD